MYPKIWNKPDWYTYNKSDDYYGIWWSLIDLIDRNIAVNMKDVTFINNKPCDWLWSSDNKVQKNSYSQYCNTGESGKTYPTYKRLDGSNYAY